MFTPFHQVVENVSATIRQHESESGRPVIGVLPAYFPLELIEAAGGYPVQLWGNNTPIGRADTYLQSYVCTVARSVLELELAGGARMVKAYCFTSVCDTLVNLKEIYSSVFKSKPALEFSIPITRTPAARRQYLDFTVKKLTESLSGICGNQVTPQSLAAAADKYAAMRELQRRLYALRRAHPGLIAARDFYTVLKAGFFLPVGVYTAMLEELTAGLERLANPASSGPRLVLSGMIFDPMPVHGLLDELGLAVADDDFMNGWRTASKPRLNVEDLVTGVAEYAFNPAPCSCLYNPDNDRHEYMVRKVRQAQAQGVLFWYIKFCEPDAFDRPQLIERLRSEGIPTALIEVEQTMTNFDAVKTRVSAFAEMLEG